MLLFWSAIASHITQLMELFIHVYRINHNSVSRGGNNNSCSDTNGEWAQFRNWPPRSSIEPYSYGWSERNCAFVTNAISTRVFRRLVVPDRVTSHVSITRDWQLNSCTSVAIEILAHRQHFLLQNWTTTARKTFYVICEINSHSLYKLLFIIQRTKIIKRIGINHFFTFCYIISASFCDLSV